MPVGIGTALVGAGLSAYGASQSNKANSAAAAKYNAPLMSAINTAQGVADQPFQQYQGPLTAPITANEQNAATLAGTTAAESQQAFQRAATPFSQGAIQQYMNPYQNMVTQNALTNLNENFNTENAAAVRKANMTDAFGYGRTAATMQPAFNAYQREAGQLADQGAAAAYSSALNEFNQQGAFQKGLGEAEGNASTSGVGALLNTGKDIREAGTQADQAQYGEFLRGQNWSRNQIQPYLQAVESLGPKLQQPTQTNVLTSAIGGAMAGYGLGNDLGGGSSNFGGPAALGAADTSAVGDINSSLAGSAPSDESVFGTGSAMNADTESNLNNVAAQTGGMQQAAGQ